MKGPEVDSARLAPYESAARIYCEMQELDPDGVMIVNHPFIAGATTTVVHWQHAAERLLDLSQMLVALKRAKEEAKPKVVTS